MLENGRREVPGSIPGRACRSEFSVVFSETRVNTGYDSLERLPSMVLPPQALVPRAINRPYSHNQATILKNLVKIFYTITF